MECKVENIELVPLSKVVSASIIDMHEDIGKTQQLFSFWAARGLDQLQRHLIKQGKRPVILTVNHNTQTATLPPDFASELFVGILNDNGTKTPLILRSNIADVQNVQEIECEEKCERCSQDKKICEDLQVTEETNLIVINDSTYEETVIKKLYPNGDYYLEKITPIWDINAETVSYKTSKELITVLDLKPCGCLETSADNLNKIKSYCADTYACYYANWDCGCVNTLGSYKIFKETGLIQFDFNFRHDKVYMEYIGSMPKIKGQYQVPKVAFETLVEWTKFRSVEGKRNIPNIDKQWRWNMYLIAKGNMRKILGRVNLSQIVEAASRIPKFDITVDRWYDNFCGNKTASLPTSLPSDSCDVVITETPTTTEIACKCLMPFQLSKLATVDGASLTPKEGLSTYTNPVLIGAVDLNTIFIDDVPQSKLAGKFTFDSATGTIDISPNGWSVWQDGNIKGNVLTVLYNKQV